MEVYTDAAFLDLKDNLQVKRCVDVSLTGVKTGDHDWKDWFTNNASLHKSEFTCKPSDPFVNNASYGSHLVDAC